MGSRSLSIMTNFTLNISEIGKTKLMHCILFSTLKMSLIVNSGTLTEHARREGFKSASSIALDISTMINKCLI